MFSQACVIHYVHRGCIPACITSHMTNPLLPRAGRQTTGQEADAPTPARRQTPSPAYDQQAGGTQPTEMQPFCTISNGNKSETANSRISFNAHWHLS